jgi:hypothetical protein
MSRLSAVAAALLALIFAAFPVACTDVDPSNPYDPSAPNTVQARATVTGRVLLETGEPAAGAEVGLQEASISGRSSEDGAFRLDDVPAGGYTLTATLPGYVVGTRIVFDLARGESRDVGTLTLARATGRIVGTLSVGGGLDVDLRSIRLGVDFGPASPSVDATGAFALEGVYAGERTLTASLPGFADATARVTVAADAAVTAPALVLEAVPVPVTVDVTAPPGFAAGDTPLALTATMNGRAQTVPVVEGTARFDAPHAGLLALSVSHPVLARFERTVQVAPRPRPVVAGRADAHQPLLRPGRPPRAGRHRGLRPDGGRRARHRHRTAHGRDGGRPGQRPGGGHRRLRAGGRLRARRPARRRLPAHLHRRGLPPRRGRRCRRGPRGDLRAGRPRHPRRGDRRGPRAGRRPRGRRGPGLFAGRHPRRARGHGVQRDDGPRR